MRNIFKATLVVPTLISATTGCEIIAGVDRSQIPADTGGSGGKDSSAQWILSVSYVPVRKDGLPGDPPSGSDQVLDDRDDVFDFCELTTDSLRLVVGHALWGFLPVKERRGHGAIFYLPPLPFSVILGLPKEARHVRSCNDAPCSELLVDRFSSSTSLANSRRGAYQHQKAPKSTKKPE